jgi:hypothetical protein
MVISNTSHKGTPLWTACADGAAVAAGPAAAIAAIEAAELSLSISRRLIEDIETPFRGVFRGRRNERQAMD